MTSLAGILLLSLSLLLISTNTRAAERSASKPQWVSKGEASLNSRRTNNAYYFKVIQNIGSDLQQLRQANTNALADYIGKRNQIEGMEITELSNKSGTSGVNTTEKYNMVFKNKFSTEEFYAQLVDEYWESNGFQYTYYALYAVSASGSTKPSFDRFEVSRSYGAAPAFMSIIPGVGQLYKGQKVKGWCMLGGAVLSAGAIIFCENERSSYVAKMHEQPKHAQTYKTKADNYETARNVAIGVTGALAVWSIIDAAVAPGVTRINVYPGEQLHIQPVAFVTPQGASFGATLCFSF